MLRLTLAACCVLLIGCGLNRGNPNANNLTLVVRGVSGDEEYAGLTEALEKPDTYVRFYEWGAPRALFVLNFQDQSIHHTAERKLANDLIAWRHDHPTGKLNIVAHSAGCGVALGALAEGGMLRVDNVVLLAPSVSPVYPIQPSLAHVGGTLHAFVSDRDITFLKIRASLFGTYDNVRTPAAGNQGFATTQPLPQFIQHRYDPAWAQLGNNGGHFGVIVKRFVRAIIAPLL